MKTRTWLFGAAAVAVLGGVLAWAFAPRPVEVELAQVSRGRFESTIEEEGKTRLADRYVVSAPLAGHLERITLREGDAVEAGATVAQLRPALPSMLDDRTLRELRARVEGAEANLLRAGTRVERAKVALQQASNEVRRSEQLAQQGFIAPTKLDTDRLSALAAQKEVEAATAERLVASHDLEQARAALSAVGPTAGKLSQRAFAVRTPATGKVLRVVQASEGMVAMGTPLIEVGDTRRLEIVAELLTTDALAARPESRVIIERWGGPVALEGRVDRIEPAAFTKISALGVEEQRVRVLIRITSPYEQWQALGDGFRVGVRIITLAQDSAVLVPVSAVFPLPAGAASTAAASSPTNGLPADAVQRMAAFVIEGGRARTVPVVLGGRNGGVAWVKSGLDEGTSVIVYPPATVRDGVRVAARKV
jgi:HlyD family secretion protein